MHLKSIELSGFKSFAKKSTLSFGTSVTAIVGPNGSGKSNIAEAFRFVLGEQSMKSLRGKRGEDLIFGGTTDAPRSNRASVKLVFDNKDRLLDIDFDEAIFERVVHRDGINQYLINGSQVRLKDIMELLAGANIGSSGHHIISQGEADRILLSNSSERKGMIEDALGLKIYQYKKHESIKKLEKTEENKKQVESLRRENAPHLKFLNKQVQKVEKAMSLREELTDFYKEYLKRESVYIEDKEKSIKNDLEGPQKELDSLNKRLKEIRELIEESTHDEKTDEVLLLESSLSAIRKERESVTRELGRLEGQIMFEEKRIEDEKRRQKENKLIPYSEIDRVVKDINELSSIDEIKKILRSFLDRFSRSSEVVEIETDLAEVMVKKDKLVKKEKDISKREKESEVRYQEIRKKIEEQKDEERGAEREMFEVMTRQNELQIQITKLSAEEERLERDKTLFKQELGEAGVLIGRVVLNYEEYSIEIKEEERDVQEDRRRKLEKMKIRLEELGGGSADEIMKEFKEVKERDEFLEKEIEDLVASVEALRKLIKDLEEELNIKFKDGIGLVNKEFQNFFELMFGGGKASIVVTKEKKIVNEIEIEEEGIEISVALPKKRIKGLVMLSGGERALTSIALIFAMSRVNPPPFIVLDETDAALDEANSRRYGDMIENLSKRSQLLLITHNRETMSRAGVLYGVTMGGDGISRLLSVKFDEAVKVAK